MTRLQIRRMPVVNRDTLLGGMISLTDIARKSNSNCASRALKQIPEPTRASLHLPH